MRQAVHLRPGRQDERTLGNWRSVSAVVGRVATLINRAWLATGSLVARATHFPKPVTGSTSRADCARLGKDLRASGNMPRHVARPR